MTVDEIQMGISDLVEVEPRSIGSDREAKEAAVWVEMEKKVEADVDALLDPTIKKAYSEHRKLTAEKKSLLEKIIYAKDRVRVGLANWIGAGHAVAGCYVKTKYRVTVIDAELVPEEYLMTVADMPQLEKWAATTEGKVAIPGCAIEPIHVLYAKETA